jgi:hypothetical protein
MRRTVRILAATGVVLALGAGALPATASTLAGSAGARTMLAGQARQPGQAGRAAPTPAQARALARARRLQALLGARGTIIGTVRRPGGAPAANVCVTASGLTATQTAFSRPDGRFIISGLPRGAYRVEYRGCSPIGRYTGQWYGGRTRGTAARVPVTSAAPVQLAPVTLGVIAPGMTGAHAPLRLADSGVRLSILFAKLRAGQLSSASPRSGRIAGRVTNRAGKPVRGVCVLAVQAGGGLFDGPVFGSQTSKSGGYTIRVGLAGRYRVDFLTSCVGKANYAPQLWRGAGSVARASVLRVRPRELIRHVDAVLGPGAAIAGRVRPASGGHHPLGGICVVAQGTGGQRLFQGNTTTRANGTFHLGDLATGKYQVQFFSGCGPASSYLPLTLRKPVAVTDGKTTAGVVARLRLGGTITGRVANAAGHALPGICVIGLTSLAPGIQIGIEVPTGADGRYQLLGLTGGLYQMEFTTGCGNNGPYAAQQLPNSVRVTAGMTTSGIDAVMQLAGSISGVVKSAGGTALAGICVVALSANGLGFAFITTKADGTYNAADLPAGNYQVEFIPGGVFSNCGNNGNFLPVTLSTTVSIGGKTSLDATLPTGGVVSGVITGAGGKRLAGICVISSSQFGNQVTTGSDGSYSMTQLFTGSYDIGFLGGCGNKTSVAPLAYRDDPTFVNPAPISVTAGQTTGGISATLRPGGTVTGRVTDRAGRPLSKLCVFISGAVGAGGLQSFADQQITSNGRYRSANLPPGQFTVSFGGMFKRGQGCAPSGKYADQDFRDRNSAAVPDLVSVSGGVTTSGIGAALAPAGTISGFVRNRAGRGVANSCVTAIDRHASVIGQAFAGSHGRYVLTDIPAGHYKVQFASCTFLFGGSGPNYASQWYKNRSSERSATTVIVRAGHVTGHVDAALAKGGSISGQVVFGSANRPVDFACVLAFGPGSGLFTSFGEGFSDRTGHYVVPGLTTGSYQVEFTPCLPESALATQVRPGTVRVVTGMRVGGINERMSVGGSVSGVVTAQTAHGATPAPGSCVELLPTTPNGVGTVTIAGAGGTYSVAGLAQGSYLAFFGDPVCSFDSPALAPAFRSGQVQVISRQTTAGVDATLALDGGISGVVSGPGRKPLAGICAEAVPLNGGGLGTVIAVTAAGRYSAIDLAPGQYKVRFESGCGTTGFATRWYKNARTKQQATVVSVSAGTVSTGISITLPRG